MGKKNFTEESFSIVVSFWDYTSKISMCSAEPLVKWDNKVNNSQVGRMKSNTGNVFSKFGVFHNKHGGAYRLGKGKSKCKD